MTHDRPSDETDNHAEEDFPTEAAADDAAERGEQGRASRKPAEAARPLRKPQPAPAAKPQPSFVLGASVEPLNREELLARYRRQHALPDDPFENGGRPKPPPGYRDRIMNDPRPVRFVERRDEQEAPAPVRRQRSFTLGQTFAIASAMALVAGAAAGVVGARFAAAPSAQPATAAAGTALQQAAPERLAPVATGQLAATPSQATQTAAARDTVIDKKPIPTATLQVADVTGQTNSFIPLALHAEPAGLDKDILIKISGVPEGAYLSSGHRGDDQIWSLSLAETKDVKLVVPQAKTPEIDLAVAAFEPKTGELAAPVKTMTVELKDVVVEPTSAPPPGQVGAAPSDAARSALLGAGQSALPTAIAPPTGLQVALATPETSETQQLINGANKLLVSGDVAAARKGFERAWGNDGSAAAAMGLARSYDPVVLAALTRGNAAPDRDQALQWYQRAAAGGNPDAAEAIVRLQMKP